MDGLWQDFRYSFRTLRKTPAFAAAAILSLALGIGANTTIFTLLNTLLWSPLPVHKPGELVAVLTLDTKNTTQFGNLLPLSYPNLIELRERNDTLAGLTGYSPALALSLSTSGAPERIFAQLVTGNYFSVLGIRAAAGRFFLPVEDRTPGTHPTVVVAYNFWQRRFGGSSDIVGRTITLNRREFTIVGVAPEGFRGVTSMFGPEIWLPSMMAPAVLPRQSGDWLHERGSTVFSSAGRLKPGITTTQAEANLKSLARALEQQYPDANKGRSISVVPLAEAVVFPGMRKPLLLGGAVLLTIVGLVLLIACSNVANLLLARAAARRREIAIRLAIGAGRSQLIRQLLTESILLGLAGGAVGLLFGKWGRDILWSFRPAVVANNFVELRLDGRVLIFTLLISLATILIFGLVPAIRASRPDVVADLKDQMRTSGRGRALTLRNVLVVGQVALSLVSLVVAGLFMRNIQQASAIDLGYDSKKLALLAINPTQGGYDRTRGEQFYREVRERMSILRGVASASWGANLPLWASQYRRIIVDGLVSQRDDAAPILAVVNTVDAGYFSTMTIPIVQGREFTRSDRDGGLPVAIINEMMARKYWPGGDPVGQRFRFDTDRIPRQIVGVAKTVKYQTLGEKPQPCVYLPLGQNYSDAMVLYVRAEDPSSVLKSVEREVRGIDPQVPVENVATVPQVIDQSLWMFKLAAGLLAVSGGLALILASVGLYGVLAYTVSRRRREIGVRMALGASQATVRRLVLGDGMILVAAGLAVGVGISLVVSRALSSLLYGISPTDPASFLGASITLGIVAFAASYLPARRASRVDPLAALREG